MNMCECIKKTVCTTNQGSGNYSEVIIRRKLKHIYYHKTYLSTRLTNVANINLTPTLQTMMQQTLN